MVRRFPSTGPKGRKAPACVLSLQAVRSSRGYKYCDCQDQRACDIYVTDLENGTPCLGVERDPRGKSLSDGILLSLKYLQIEFLKWKATKAVDIEHTIRDLYTSLSVLTNQVWVPVSVV